MTTCRITRLCTGLLVTLLFNLSGCTPAPEAQWQDYRQRLSRVLDTDLDEATTSVQNESDTRETSPAAVNSSLAEPMPLPSFKTAPELSEHQITLIDVARLHACGLDQVISARNSSLGKVMPAAVALHYELTLLDLLPACIALPDIPRELQQRLIDIRQLKLRELPARFAWMLATDNTLRSQLQGSKRGITDMAGQTQTHQALLSLLQSASALQTLSQQTDRTSRPAPELMQQPWMDALSALHQSQRLADLQHSVRQSLEELTRLNDALNALTVRCKSGQRQVMDQVLQQIFIKRLQPMLAQTDQSLTELTPLLSKLYDLPQWRELIAARYTNPQQQLQIQLKRHVRWWQTYQQQCR